ncbi:MAG: hypothetical protein GY851_28840 [bacterium]|nr:hypothetical protein [bacterium]
MSNELNDVKQSLDEVRAVMARTRQAMAYSGSDVVMMMWGAIWFVGFMASHFLDGMEKPLGHVVAGYAWLLLVGLGVTVTLVVSIRTKAPFRNPMGARMGIFWGLLYGYIWLGYALLHPFINYEAFGAGDAGKYVAAINTLVPMFAYVVMGLWFERYFIWIGLAVTGLLFLGLFVFQPIFYIWMAFLGGGTLAGTGYFIRKTWRKPLGIGTGEASHA